MLLSRVRRISNVDRHLFCTLEYLIVQYLVDATEWSLRVNNDPLYVCNNSRQAHTGVTGLNVYEFHT